MSDMKVQVLIDLLYDSGKAQQAAKDLQLIEDACRGADSASQALGTDFTRAESAMASFGATIAAAGSGAVSAAQDAYKAQTALLDVGRGFGTAGEEADTAVGAFARAEAQLAEVRAGLAAALPAPDLGPLKGAANEAVAAFERAQAEIARIAAGFGEASGRTARGTFEQLQAEMARIMAEPLPAPDLRAIKTATRNAQVTFEQLQAEMARVMAEPVHSGIHAEVDATVAAMREELSLEREIAALAGRGGAGPFRPAAPASSDNPWTFPNGAAVPPITPAEGAVHERVSQQNAETAAAIAAEDRAQERQASERRAERDRARAAGKPLKDDEEGHSSGLGGMIEGAIGFVEAGVGLKLVEGTIEQGAEAKTMDAHLRAAGVPEDDIDKLHQAARDISRDGKIFSFNKAMDNLVDARTVTGSTEHAIEVAKDLNKLLTISESVNPGHGASDAFEHIKAAESAGATNAPEDLHAFLQDQAKTIEFYKNTIPSYKFKDFYQAAGPAGRHLPEEVRLGALPHLLQEQDGRSVGVMMKMMDRAVNGGIMAKRSIESLDELGLVHWDKVTDDGKGHYTLNTGAIEGTGIPGHPFNALEWAVKTYDPALHGAFKPELKEHPLSSEDIDHHFSTDFSNSNVAGAVSKLITQAPVIAKDLEKVRETKGLSAADDLLHTDPHLAWEAIQAQTRTMMKNAGDPIMDHLLGIGNAVSNGMAHVNEVTEKVPGSATALVGGAALGAGYMGWKTLEHGFFESLKFAGRAATDLGTLGLLAEWASKSDMGFPHPLSPDQLAYKPGSFHLPGEPGYVPTGSEASPIVSSLHELTEAMREQAHRSADDFRRDPEAARGRALVDHDRQLRASDALAVPDFLRRGSGEPIHVVVDGEKGKPGGLDGTSVTWRPPFGTAEHPAGLGIQFPDVHAPATGGTATPSLAQPPAPVTNNTTNATTNTYTYHVSAPVTVNVSSPTAAPAAVGGAIAGALTSAVKQSPGVLHDGYGPH